MPSARFYLRVVVRFALSVALVSMAACAHRPVMAADGSTPDYCSKGTTVSETVDFWSLRVSGDGGSASGELEFNSNPASPRQFRTNIPNPGVHARFPAMSAILAAAYLNNLPVRIRYDEKSEPLLDAVLCGVKAEARLRPRPAVPIVVRAPKPASPSQGLVSVRSTITALSRNKDDVVSLELSNSQSADPNSCTRFKIDLKVGGGVPDPVQLSKLQIISAAYAFGKPVKIEYNLQGECSALPPVYGVLLGEQRE